MDLMLKAKRKSSISEQVGQKIVIGVAGGSAAGKTTLCENIMRQMAFDSNFSLVVISLDSFYKSIDKDQVNVADYNFDHPRAIDFDLAYKTLLAIIEGRGEVPIPQYCFVNHKRLDTPTYIKPANIIMFEGLMAFYDPRIRDLLTYKIFINCDDDIRLCRRIQRDTKQRGRTIESVLLQYNRFVKGAFRDFIMPSQVYADLIIPGFRSNRVSVDFIVQHIKNIAKKINFMEKISKNKLFFFGQNEFFDLTYKDNTSLVTQLHKPTFLVFPTSEQNLAELQFYLSSLLSEIFAIDYFTEVFLDQFCRICKKLLQQLINLKNFQYDRCQLISWFPQNSKIECDNTKNVLFVFVPFLSEEQGHILLSQILKVDSSKTIVLITIFSQMRFPKQIYKTPRQDLIFLNLFLIANEKRFTEVLNSNAQSQNLSFIQALIEPSIEIFAKIICRSKIPSRDSTYSL